MLASVTREEALALLRTEHAEIRRIIDALTDEQMVQPDTVRHGLYPGESYAFKDLLSHLCHYEQLALAMVDAWHIGEIHTESERVWTDGYNVHMESSAKRAHYALDEMLNEWDETQAALEAAFDEMSDAEWRAVAPYPTDEPTDLGGVLEKIIVAPPRPLYRHLPVHIPDPAAYIKRLRGS